MKKTVALIVVCMTIPTSAFYEKICNDTETIFYIQRCVYKEYDPHFNYTTLPLLKTCYVQKDRKFAVLVFKREELDARKERILQPEGLASGYFIVENPEDLEKDIVTQWVKKDWNKLIQERKRYDDFVEFYSDGYQLVKSKKLLLGCCQARTIREKPDATLKASEFIWCLE